jgi:hypothetical protein
MREGATIELARRAQSQTDNWFEGVFEARDLLQSSVIEPAEGGFLGVD